MSTSTDTAGDYRARFESVLQYIDRNLEADLSLERLSEVASFSKFHFQRQFAALFGIGAFRYVQLTRLKRAGFELAFRPDRSVLEIALSCGYEAPESFARTFKKIFGQSPTDFRAQPDWQSWQAHHATLRELRINHMTREPRTEQVQIVDFKETRVAAVEHRGDPRLLGESIRRFIAWRRENRLPPSISATFNVLYDDPEDTEPENFRFDLCAAVKSEIVEGDSVAKNKVIPGGRCAVLRHVGSDDTLGESIRWLYSHWLPQSGESLRDFPLFIQRVRFFPDVPEHEATSDIHLPLR